MEHKFCSTISIFLSTITFFCCSNALKNELVSLKWRRRYLVSLIHFLLYLWSKPILRSIDKEIPLSFISIFGCSICFESIERSHWTMSVNQGREAVTGRVIWIYNDWAENRAYIFRWALGGTYKKGLEHIRNARAWIRFRSPYKVIIRALQLVLHYVLVSIGWHHCRTQNVIGPRNWSTVMWPAPIGWWHRVSPAIYTTWAQDRGVCCFGSSWDSSSLRLGSTPPSASSTVHCRQQPLLRESPPVARARPHTFHAVYCLGVSPTPPGGLECPVIRVTRAPRIKNL